MNTPASGAAPLQITETYAPGDLAGVVGLHMAYYAPAWGFGRGFETKVAREMAAFLDAFAPDRDVFLAARDPAGTLVGSISVDGAYAGSLEAHLRWFIVSDSVRGTGLGRRLFQRAVEICDQRGVARAYLTTFSGLDPARHLYESTGFVLVSTSEVDQWGGGVQEQRFERPA